MGPGGVGFGLGFAEGRGLFGDFAYQILGCLIDFRFSGGFCLWGLGFPPRLGGRGAGFFFSYRCSFFRSTGGGCLAAEQARQNFFGRSGQRQLALVQRIQEITHRKQGRAVGHHDYSARRSDVLEGVFQLDFGVTVKVGRRFIQQHHRRIANQCARNGDALSLPTRQTRTGLTNLGGIAIGQVDDKMVHAGFGGGLDDIFVAGVGFARCDVVANGTGEQHTFLGNVSQPVRKFAAGKLRNICAIKQDAASLRAVQPLNQFQQRGLAAAVAPHQCMNTAFGDINGDARHHRGRIGRIAKHQIFKGDIALGSVQLDFADFAFGLACKNNPQPFGSLKETGIDPPRSDQLVERPKDATRQHIGGNQRADGQALVDDGKRAHRGYQD